MYTTHEAYNPCQQTKLILSSSRHLHTLRQHIHNRTPIGLQYDSQQRYFCNRLKYFEKCITIFEHNIKQVVEVFGRQSTQPFGREYD